jgi:hypothetical protein
VAIPQGRKLKPCIPAFIIKISGKAMSKIGLLLVCSLWAFVAHAQFGINSSFRFNNAPGWNYTNTSNNNVTVLPGNNFAVGLDVWIPLKGVRLDLVPELNYTRYISEVVDLGTLENEMGSIFMNLNLYFLDLKGDCKCPTFSKSGSLLNKGLYLQVSPGWSVFQGKINLFNGAGARSRSYAPNIGIGMGLDMGLSEKITITPFGGVRYYPKARWFGLEESLQLDPSAGDLMVSNESTLTQVYAGLRIGFRLDKQ